MVDLVVETPEGVPLRFELAGPGARMLAALVDGILFTGLLLAATIVTAALGLSLGQAWLASGTLVLLVAYAFASAAWSDGRSPGKRWTGLRVCDAQGFTPTTVQLFLRALFVPLEALLVVPVPIVWILIAATPERQRLGDLVAGTRVVRERARRAAPEPAPGLRWSELESRRFALEPAAARALSGRDLGFLRDLLTRVDLEPEAYARLHRSAARHYAERLGQDPSTVEGDGVEGARTFLRELFLLLRELRQSRNARPDAS